VNITDFNMRMTEADKAEVHEEKQPPDGFQLRRDGIYQRVKAKNNEIEWRWLCSPIRVIALPRGADGKGWGRLLEIVDPDGNCHRWAAPAELFAGDGLELRRECLRLGLRLSTANGARAALSDLLQQWTPEARVTATDRLGWIDERCTAFLAGSGRVIGKESVVFQSAHAPGAAAEMKPNGSLKDWRETVSAACIGNSLMVLSVSLAFAGALFEPMQIEGGGLHLRGQSSRGKSTIMRAAVSVWGSPKLMQSWRATANGLEGVATAGNGSLVALDELGEVSGREAGATAYMLANGQGKARAARSGAAKPAARWRTAILSNGEISLADKMAETGHRARAGQQVRLLEIQADGQTFGAFDDIHEHATPAGFAEFVGRMSATAYGTAGPAFVEQLIGNRDVGLADVRAASETFATIATNRLGLSEEGQSRRALGRFALIAAAGEVASNWGITGWAKGEAIDASLNALRIWLDGRGGGGSAEDREAVERTRAFIVKHGDARFERLDAVSDRVALPIQNRAGWREGPYYYIAADVWRNEVHAGADAKQAARAVKNSGHLMPENSGSRLTAKAPRSAGRARCYRISDTIMAAGDD